MAGLDSRDRDAEKIMYELKDQDGNRFQMHRGGELWLKLATKPKSGSQNRYVGKKVLGTYVFKMERTINGWHREAQCWFVSRFVMIHREKFGVRLFRIVGDAPGRPGISGYFHPEIILSHGETRHWAKTGYELQLKLYPSDLKNTADEAMEFYQQWAAERGRPLAHLAPPVNKPLSVVNETLPKKTEWKQTQLF